MGKGVSMLAHSFLTGIKARTSLISGLWFPWPIYMFFEMRFDLGTLDSGERSLPFGLLVSSFFFPIFNIEIFRHTFLGNYEA